MFWREGRWSVLDAFASQEAVESLNNQLAGGRNQTARLKFSEDANTEFEKVVSTSADADQTAARLVMGTARRALGFYHCSDHACDLYRFDCRFKPKGELDGYRPTGAFFAVRVIASKSRGDEKKAADQASDSEWILLDWTSPPIHTLNERLGLDLKTRPCEDWEEYWKFFVSFIGIPSGPDGLIHPFLLHRTSEDILNPDHDQEDYWRPPPSGNVPPVLPSFERVAASGYSPLKLFEVDKSTGDQHESCPFDLTAERPDPEYDSATLKPVPELFAKPYSPSSKDPIEAVKKLYERPEYKDQAFTIETESKGEEDVTKFTAPIMFKDQLFEAEFKVEHGGEVEMIDDKPVAGAARVPAQSWEVRRRPDGIAMLCLQTLRRFLERDHLFSGAKRKTEQFQNRRVAEKIEAGPMVEGGLVLSDVEFTEPVILDGATFQGNLEFRNCRFMFGLSLRDATVNGSLVLNGSIFEGAAELIDKPERNTDEQSVAKPVLDLSSLRVKRSALFDGVTVHGSFDAQAMSAESGLRARGLSVHLRHSVRYSNVSLDDTSKPALNLAHLRVQGPVDFSILIPEEFQGGGLDHKRRTWISHNAAFDQANADGIRLNGAVIGGSLNFDGAQVAGAIDLNVQAGGSTTGQWVKRVRIGGRASLRFVCATEIIMSGCLIGDDADLCGARARAFWADPVQASLGDVSDSHFGLYRFRTRKGVILSAACINEVDLSGADVGAELLCITGWSGRLLLRLYPWGYCFKNKAIAVLTPFRASGLVLWEHAIEDTVSCHGLQLIKTDQRGYASGGIITEGLSIGGGLRFWGRSAKNRLQQQLSGCLTTQGDDATNSAIDDAIAGVRAVIQGDVDFRGLRCQGTVNLSRLTIEGGLDLNNSTMGALLAYEGRASNGGTPAASGHASLTCRKFTARNADVAGDVELMGLRVEQLQDNGEGGNYENIDDKAGLDLSEMTVGGVLALESESQRAEHGARIVCGRLSLGGASANWIIISSKNVEKAPEEAQEADQAVEARSKAALSLERIKVGRLTIRGFEVGDKAKETKFPRTINLSAVEVGDWDFNPGKGRAMALLKALKPFDGRVYLDMEERLSRIGSRNLADEIYRAMVAKNRKALTRGDGQAKFSAAVSLINGLLSGNGTRPFRLIGIFLVSIVLNAFVLVPASNIETIDEKDLASVAVGEYWSVWKGIGLAVDYAVPFFGGHRADLARARHVGPTCINADHYDTEASECVDREFTGGGPWVGSWSISRAPHDIAMVFSAFQFFLWLVLAAAIPTLIRRRPD